MATGSASDAELQRLAARLRVAVALLRRRLRQAGGEGLTVPESAALSRLDRGGPATAAALAKAEQISPQAMGVTIAALRAQGLVDGVPDPEDGRRVVISITDVGLTMLRERRSARNEQLAAAIAAGLEPQEIALLRDALPVLERLAETL